VVFSGFTIPALATRRVETDVELGEGQSFAIAGLIDDRVTNQFSKIPGLANIPILGALFKSKSVNKTKTELVVLVTPEAITPYNPDDLKPGPTFSYPGLPETNPGMRGITKVGPIPTANLREAIREAENRCSQEHDQGARSHNPS
jgi:pilus assembly protein CpaC